MPIKHASQERTAAAFGGAGSGLGIVTVAHSLPADFAWAQGLLEYIAPLASIGIALGWAHLLSRYQRRQLMQRLEDATNIRDRVFANRASSKHAKQTAQRSLERVASLVSQLLVSEAERLAGIDGTVALPPSHTVPVDADSGP